MPADVLAFGPFQLDVRARRLSKDGEPLTLSGRQFEVLHALVVKAGEILSKDQLVDSAWDGVAVTDNSVEKAVSSLRRLLDEGTGAVRIETLARRGYRFTGVVTRVERRESDAALDALLAPHRAWIEGRAALETLNREQIVRTRQVFESVLEQAPDQAAAHVGLANACVMQFEMSRAQRDRDELLLRDALRHAREACRLDVAYGEAWATLGFVLDRAGQHRDALASSRRAVVLEPGNWRHHMRLAYVSWGEERLREADRTLSLLPEFPLAHWLSATVYVARQAFDAADRHLAAGTGSDQAGVAHPRFEGVALHWLHGLIRLAHGDETAAEAAFTRELQLESRGQLYARECCANTWYALGALRLARGQRAEAIAALGEALARVPAHPAACVMLTRLGAAVAPPLAQSSHEPARFDAEGLLAHAVGLCMDGQVATAADAMGTGLAEAPEGSALWLVPVEPALRVWEQPDVWAPVLARLRSRAA